MVSGPMVAIPPPGYAGTRAVALKLIDLLGSSGYVEPDTGHAGLPPAEPAVQETERPRAPVTFVRTNPEEWAWAARVARELAWPAGQLAW